MAISTKPHRVIDLAFRDCLLPHVAMAHRTIDPRPNVGRMIEPDMRGGLEPVDALPWDIFAPRFVSRELLDLWLVRGDHLMTRHAKIDAGNSRIGTLIDPHVAIRALHAVAEMHFMREGDRLDRFRARAEEFANGIGNRAVLRRE